MNFIPSGRGVYWRRQLIVRIPALLNPVAYPTITNSLLVDQPNLNCRDVQIQGSNRPNYASCKVLPPLWIPKRFHLGPFTDSKNYSRRCGIAFFDSLLPTYCGSWKGT